MFGDTGEDLNDYSGLVGDQSVSDFQKELEHLKPVNQSSPAESIGECIDVSKKLGVATRLAASFEKTGNHDEVSLGDDNDVDDVMVGEKAAEVNDKIDVTEYDENDDLQAILSAQNDLRMKL
ncbi:hypothetical protein CHS0354_013069 [Potamilus streckersoni]|uniref:Uncharacterized protein n=1 Tax=Potamilus streckersoni TaxID=2493646 RepID=A0AAE0WC28_9BIVA|nr:hypothetical protein CHS0354_013069 [Potamilus streckersoni]